MQVKKLRMKFSRWFYTSYSKAVFVILVTIILLAYKYNRRELIKSDKVLCMVLTSEKNILKRGIAGKIEKTLLSIC